MVILRLKLDNILSFNEFDVSFSYPTKLRTSLVDKEYLKDVPSFRYKKLNIFIGSNASGKTSLIKIIWKTLLFLSRKEKETLISLVSNPLKTAIIEMDYCDYEYNKNNRDNILRRIKLIIKDGSIDVAMASTKLSTSLTSNDSYENKSKKLDVLSEPQFYLDALRDFDFKGGWNMLLPATEPEFDKVHLQSFDASNSDAIRDEKLYLQILNSVFKTLDPSIVNVERSKDVDNAIVITHEIINKIIIQNGMPLSSIPFLSSGTKYGINISNMMYSIYNHENGIYLIDEQFSYLNSDIEVAILSTMVSMLGDDEQIFFTTHNNEILSLGYPFHSFYFLKKEMIGDKREIKISCGLEAENRNNVSPKTLLDNDAFGTCPDVSRIYELGEN